MTPTARDVREYRRLRRLSRRLATRLANTIPPRALEETGTALGLYRDGQFEMPCEAAIHILADCCVHEWRGQGQSLVRLYAAERLPADERRLLELWQGARLALLRIDRVWPGVGMRVHDGLEGNDLVLLDRALSREPGMEGVWLVARIHSPGGYWMTTEAPIPLGPLDDSTLATIRRKVDLERGLSLPRIAIAVQSALEELEEEGHGEEGEGGRPRFDERGLVATLPPRRPGRNEPCPCGSGKKFKECCAFMPRAAGR